MIRAKIKETSIWIVVGSAIAALVVGSPLILMLASDRSFNWSRASDIGQSYGFASAFLSAAALFAVARSVTLQQKQNRVVQTQHIKTMHAEVLRLAITSPNVYMPIYGASDEESILRLQRHFFLTYRSQYWLSMFDLGEVGEREIKGEYVDDLTASAIGRDWWSIAGPYWRASDARPLMRRFAMLVDGGIAERESRSEFQDQQMGGAVMKDEVSGLQWRKSTRCAIAACVEVAFDVGNTVYVRSSEEPSQMVKFSASEWSAFLAGVSGGEFALPEERARVAEQ